MTQPIDIASIWMKVADETDRSIVVVKRVFDLMMVVYDHGHILIVQDGPLDIVIPDDQGPPPRPLPASLRDEINEQRADVVELYDVINEAIGQVLRPAMRRQDVIDGLLADALKGTPRRP
jgi:hypothetical protein